MIDLYNYSLLTIFLAGLVLIVASIEIGRFVGVRVGKQGGENVSTLEAAVLGLLALMIGFTFAMALSRFEARRDAVVNEANAIGTTALRARLLPEPYRAEALKLLREYVQIRLDLTQRPASQTELMSAINRSNAIQEALWQQAEAISVKDSGMVPAGLFIQTLNEMIDTRENVWQRTATESPTLCRWCYSGSPPSPVHLPDMRVGSTPNAIACLSTPPV